MQRLNKKQKEILNLLDEVYPASLKKSILLEKLGNKPNNILADIKLLEKNKLVDLIYGVGDNFPAVLTITPMGKEKLQENFITRLRESAYNNPWPMITVIVMIVLGLIASNYYFETINLEKEKASLEKPLLIAPDTRVQGNSIGELKFIIKNPSHSTDYYYVSGSCSPYNPELFSQPPPDENIQQSDLPNRPDAPLIIQPTQKREILIPAGGEITLQCTNNYIKNPSRDIVTYLNICVNIRNIQQPICNRMQVTILKT